MRYREIKPRWKYLLGANYAITTGILPSAIIDVPYLHPDMAGILTIEGGAEGGYMWDGPSGPMRDTPTAMRGSLVHDAFYQLLRMGLLDYDPCKRQADELFQRICIADGMGRFRAWYALRGLRFGRPKEPEKGDTPEWIVIPEPEVA